MFNHRIPNEFSRSDKIGPFSFAQLGVLGMGGFVLMAIMLSTSNLWFVFIAFLIMVPITLGLMFVKVNKLPVYEFLFKYIVFISTPRLLVYRSDNIKRLDLEDELIGFEERVIAENTVKTIKGDAKKNQVKKKVEMKQANNKKKVNKK